ncbi:hypothetical protein HPP92_017870 [Vanilla planifolia]|uniref:Uncharacterized protein n=1 Tax=Vanilla planifolia TaxID=51239 RepID=A0A835QGB6_VANPL|nr:hypothetical protein HPP92_018445 [Vanilla planifolia]KAG0468542.1 hypothetical protein HPP92_017870 [Vanilla planifolia]
MDWKKHCLYSNEQKSRKAKSSHLGVSCLFEKLSRRKIIEAALSFIENVTANANEVQHQVLGEILRRNASEEYLQRHGLTGSCAREHKIFRRLIQIVTYEDVKPDILRIADGEKSHILSGHPITEFLTSSGTSGGECKLIPSTSDDFD